MALAHGAQEPLGVRDGLVLYLDAANRRSYPGSGTTWFDRSGNGNNGTLVNGVGFDSNNFGSLSFDGVNDYVNLGSSSNYAFGTNDFSIECWVWRNGSQSSNASFVITYPNSFGTAPSTSWQLCVGNPSYNEENKLVFYIGGAPSILSDSIIMADQSWTYCAVTGSGSTLKLYKNGILIDSNTSPFNLSDDDLAIGTNRGGNSYWNGLISNVKLYKGKALTAQEIQQNYNALKGRYQ